MKCLLCRHNKVVQFLNLGLQPLANKYPATEEEFIKEDFFPLKIFFCTECKNVQLGTIISRERMFQDYYYLSSVNPGLVRHFEQFAQKIAHAKFVVDIGSNDGILLKPLKKYHVKAIGVDPSVNVSKIANDAGLKTIVSFFNKQTAETIKKRYGKPDIIVASSIFTHLEDPHQFIKAVKSLMADNGKFIIEVEYIGNIIKHVQFERFYLDRIFYYSLTSLKHLFGQYEMQIVDVEKIEPHGGSIRVTVERESIKQAPSKRVAAILADEKKNLTLSKLKKFKQRVDSHIVAFRNKLERYKKKGLMIAGYSAPARVSTICNYGKIKPPLIEFIVDDSPLKQNRFSPGTHIPIVNRDFLKERRPDILVVFAYEYFDDIKKKTGGHYRYLIPIPPKKMSQRLGLIKS